MTGSSSQRMSYSASSSAMRMAYGTFHELHASSMMSTSSPTASRRVRASVRLRRIPGLPSVGPSRKNHLVAVNPSAANRAARLAAASGSIEKPSALAYAGNRVRVGPPSNSYTGLPSALPLRSHNPQSTTLIAIIASPLRP